MFSSRFPRACAIAAVTAAAASVAIAQQWPNFQGQRVTVANFGGSLQQAIRDGWVEPCCW